MRLFIDFLKNYFIERLLNAGRVFENIKDIIVAFLIVKRGRYSSSFLNTSFLIIVAAAFIGGPTIVANSPFAKNIDQSTVSAATVVSYDPSQGALETIVSDKGRTEVVEYTVKGGDTISGVAAKFGVSEDTIRWANNDIKGDVIKPGQVLKVSPVTGVVHKVASGETVYSIAKKYHVDAQNIVNFPFNDFVDLDTFSLSAGQTLYVPGGTIVPVPVVNNSVFAQVFSGVRGPSNFIWPTTGIITQYPIWYHMALDIANNAQPAIIAADGGTVVASGWNNTGYGNMVLVAHGNGYETLYAHMSQILVSMGQHVSQGQQIGVMGSTGRSTGTHLHFEVRSNGVLLNPLNFLK